MIISLILNAFTALLALSLTGGVALHDTRLDKAFAGAVAPRADTSVHDYSHALDHEVHIHSSHSPADPSDPMLASRSHRKHAAMHHSRIKLAALTA